MDVVVTSHPVHGYQFDIQKRQDVVKTIPDLSLGRSSVFDEVRTPAYK